MTVQHTDHVAIFQRFCLSVSLPANKRMRQAETFAPAQTYSKWRLLSTRFPVPPAPRPHTSEAIEKTTLARRRGSQEAEHERSTHVTLGTKRNVSGFQRPHAMRLRRMRMAATKTRTAWEQGGATCTFSRGGALTRRCGRRASTAGVVRAAETCRATRPPRAPPRWRRATRQRAAWKAVQVPPSAELRLAKAVGANANRARSIRRAPEYRRIDDAELLLIVPAAEQEPSRANAKVVVHSGGRPLPGADLLFLYPTAPGRLQRPTAPAWRGRNCTRQPCP